MAELKLITDMVSWMEYHPVISAGLFSLLGAIISTVFDFRKRAINKITAIKNIRNLNFIFGNHNTIGHVSQSENDIREDTPVALSVKPEDEGPLNKTQLDICKKVEDYSTRYSQKLNIKSHYENAVRNLNIGETCLAAGNFVQIFSSVVKSLRVVADSNNTNTELNNLMVLTESLMNIKDTADDEAIKSQIGQCEKMLSNLLIRLPL